MMAHSYPGSASDLNELDRALGIFGRATTETYLDPSDRYDAIKHVRDYLLGLRERMLAPAQGAPHCGESVHHGAFVANNNARQIVCDEWQKAVKEFRLRPGSITETIVSRIINRIDDVTSRYPVLPSTEGK